MQSTVELTKQQKLKKLNQKLNLMLQKKKQVIKQTKIQQPKIQLKQKSQIKQTQQPKTENPEKTKKIRKSPLINITKKKILRKAAGYVWEDPTLSEWNQTDYRIFCGNLGNQVTDQILGNTFRKYNSFQKAKVIRDKRTGKTKGYGFVAFSNPNDFLNCLKQMQGKHVGNRPVRLKKSNWKDRNIESEKNQILPSDFRRNSKKKSSIVNPNFLFTGKL